MGNANLTAEQRIERVHMRIMQDKHLCLFGGIIMIGDNKVPDKVPTACTNGRVVESSLNLWMMAS